MTRRLIAGLLVLLALGAVLDGTAHRFWAGRQTIGQSQADVASAEGIALVRSVPTLIGMAGDPEALEGRYSLYHALRRRAPSADVIVGERVAGVVDIYLETIGRASSVRRVDVGGLGSALDLLGPPTESGVFRGGPWTLRVADGDVERLLIMRDDQGVHVVDVRLASASDPVAIAPPVQDPPDVPTTARELDDPPSLLRAILVDGVVLALLTLAGGVLVPRGSLSPSRRLILAAVAGIALQGAAGLVLPQGWSGPVVVASATLLIAAWSRRRGAAIGWDAAERKVLLLGLAGLVVIVAVARAAAFLYLTADSHVYWTGGAALADGTFGPAAVELKRGVALQAIHAVGFLLGVEGIQALGALTLALTLLLLASVALGERPWRGPVPLAGLVGTGAVLMTLVASPQVRAFAAYLNSHLLVALVLASLAVLLGTARADQRRDLLPAVAALITLVVVARAEGPLLVGMLLLGTLTLREERLPWAGAWWSLGGATLAWSGLLLVGTVQRGEGLSNALVPLVASVFAAFAVPIVLGRVPVPFRRAVPLIAGASLWGVAGALAVFADGVRFFDVAVENVGQGAGLWGVVGPLLALLGVLAVALGDQGDARLAPGRWFLIGFVPITMLVKLGDGLQGQDADWGTLLSGGGRIGWGDSVNRMWTHAIIVVLLLLLVRVGQAQPTESYDPGVGSGSAAGRVWTVGRLATLLGVAVWLALQWQPAHLPRPTGVPTVLSEVSGDRPMVELVDGARVQQMIIPPTLDPVVDLPYSTRPVAVCADVRFVTFARDNAGSVELSLSLAGATERRSVPASGIEDWGREEICLDLDRVPEGVLPGPLHPVTVEVVGVGGAPGASVGVLDAPADVTSPGGGGALVAVDAAAGVPTGRLAGPLVMDLTIVSDPPSAFLSRTIDRIALLLPWVMLLLGSVTVVVDRRASRMGA